MVGYQVGMCEALGSRTIPGCASHFQSRTHVESVEAQLEGQNLRRSCKREIHSFIKRLLCAGLVSGGWYCCHL